jgi:tetratricopeptide (TPR) repeat protein
VTPKARAAGKPARYLAWAAAALLLAACRPTPEEKGFASLGLGDYPTAIRAFTAAVEEDPGAYGTRLGLGQALLQKAAAESDSAAFAYGLLQLEACRTLRPAADLDALLADAWVDRARDLARRRDTLRALEALARAAERDPRAPAPLSLAGILYGKRGDLDKAEALFAKALQADSADASSHFNLGMLRWRAGRVREAHGHWLKALQARPDDEDLLHWFAQAEKRLREAP